MEWNGLRMMKKELQLIAYNTPKVNPPLRSRHSRWRGFEPRSNHFENVDNWLCRNIKAHSQRLVLLANTTTVAKQNKLLCPSVAEPHLKQALLIIAPTRCESEEKRSTTTMATMRWRVRGWVKEGVVFLLCLLPVGRPSC